MRRIFKRSIAIALAAAMVITAAPANEADAAKKKKNPSMQKKASVTVGKTVKIKIKNSNKKAKVKFKSNKPKIAKIKKQVKKGVKASVTVKGMKKGTAKITATYKVGKKKAKKFTCKVTVKKKKKTTKATTAPAQNTQAPVVTNTPVAPTATNNATTPEKTADPTKVPATPRPSATPTNAPKNASLDATKLGEEDKIEIDGKAGKAEWENAGKAQDLMVNPNSVRGNAKIKAATARLAWTDKAVYALVEADSEMKEVKLFIDEDGKTDNANAKSATATLSDDKKTAEVKIDLASAPDMEKGLKAEIQITDGDATINYFDSFTEIKYDADKNEWKFEVSEVKAGKDDSVLGTLNLLPSLAQATNAYFTDKGADIIKAAKLPEDFEEKAEGATWTNQKTKTMTFVDTKYWTDAYAANDSNSIYFTNVNIPDWQGDADHVGLATEVTNPDGTKKDPREFESSRENAQGYIIWDKDYLYVLFDINDSDISPANTDHYTTDSTEFFLDENYSQPSTYDTGDGDEVQLRIDAANNVFSSNDSGTGNYELVAHAVNYKEADGKKTGYQVEYIIKLNNKHVDGDIMGMDLQINDCYTQYTYKTDADGNATEEIDDTVEPVAARAATLTAYDTTNNDYQNPSCFGRVKLINKNESGETDPTPTPIVLPTPAADIPAYDVTSDAIKVMEASGSSINVTGSDFVVSGDALCYTGDAYVVSEGAIYIKDTETAVTGTALVVSGDSIIVSGGSLEVLGDAAAYKTAEAIEADGKIDAAWDAIPFYTFKSEGDTQAMSKIAWDKGNLYVLVRVLDPSYDVASDKNYERDGLEIFFDEDNSKEKKYDNNDDAIQYRYTGFAVADKITQEITAGCDAAKKQYKDIKSAYNMTVDGYVVEVKIPFAKEAKAGQTVGFEANVFDCADGKRNAEMFLLTKGGALYNNPSLFGEVTLYSFDEPHLGLVPTDYVPPVKIVTDNEKAYSELVVSDKQIAAYKAASAIEVDGDVDDAWNAIPYFAFQNDATAAKGTEAIAKVAWDAEKLYGFIRVKDDTKYNTASKDNYQRDGIEFFFDENNDKVNSYKDNADAFQYRYTGFADADTKKKTDEIVSGDTTKATKDAYAGIKTAYADVADGYVVEFAIPWTDASTVAANKLVGFDMSVFACSEGKRDKEIRFIGSKEDLYGNASHIGIIELLNSTDDTAREIKEFVGNGTKKLDLSKLSVQQYNNAEDELPIITQNDDGTVNITFPKAYWPNVAIDLSDIDMENYGEVTVAMQNLTSANKAGGAISVSNPDWKDADNKNFGLDAYNWKENDLTYYGDTKINLQDSKIPAGTYATKLEIKSQDPGHEFKIEYIELKEAHRWIY